MEDCRCDEFSRELHCKDIMNPHSLQSIMHILSEFPLSVFSISDSFLMYIPSGMFKRAPTETLEIYNSEILGWESENGSVVFEGTENTLETITMYKVNGMNSWKWSVFSTLRKLEHFSIGNGNLDYVNKDFSLISPKSLRKLHLDFVNLKSIHPEAFSNHEELIMLSLAANKLQEVKRSMFPNPAKELKYLILSHNKLKSLPEDMFIGMPKLVVISLEGNRIRFLSEEFFPPLIGRDWNMYINGNDLYCCTDMKWIVNKQIKERVVGRCSHPQILKDKEITQLEDFDFTHGLC